MAPPETAIIISPDISLACRGLCWSASERSMEKMLAHMSPVMNMLVSTQGVLWGMSIMERNVSVPVMRMICSSLRAG
ncbi:unknown [Tannerella sp. CAG:118]|nr:hypothetical protein PU94_15700 [Coprobacter secundus]CCY38763.1 unknown [Tannerella sp. CAG:118]